VSQRHFEGATSGIQGIALFSSPDHVRLVVEGMEKERDKHIEVIERFLSGIEEKESVDGEDEVIHHGPGTRSAWQLFSAIKKVNSAAFGTGSGELPLSLSFWTETSSISSTLLPRMLLPHSAETPLFKTCSSPIASTPPVILSFSAKNYASFCTVPCETHSSEHEIQ
jgi:hypothetical protein